MLNVVLTIRAENVADTFTAHWLFALVAPLSAVRFNNSTVGDSFYLLIPVSVSFFLRSTIPYYT